MRLPPVARRAAASSASAWAARPPSIINAPSGPGIAITLHPAPWSSVTPPRSAVEIRAAACCALADDAGRRTPPNAAALVWRKCRRDNARPVRLKPDTTSDATSVRLKPDATSCLLRSTGGRVLVDRLMDDRFAERRDVRPHALRRAQHRPHGALSHQRGRAQLAEQGRFLLEHGSLQRHERHEPAR